MTTTGTQVSKGMNTAIWIGQLILAAMFLMAGVMKSTMPIDKLSVTVTWAKDVPEMLVRFIGISEFLGALGLLLPSLLRIRPRLTPVAAMCLASVLLMAIVFHIYRGEAKLIGMHIVMAAMAIFIVWGRMVKAPILARK